MKLSLWCHLVGSLVIGLGWVNPAVAEVVPDSTISRPSQVTQSGNRVIITEGTQRGRNLFHSFQEFSTPLGETASFQGVDAEVANIFARVTGRNASRINGIVEVLQANHQISTANLFLLNPHGIIFGEGAALRIGGSLIATTANSIDFADGSQFSAVNPQAAPLLTVSVPTGLQFGDRPGSIVNRSAQPLFDALGNPVLDSFGNSILGLTVNPDRTLALIGGNVTLAANSSLRTDGGRIEIGSVAQNGQVTLTAIPNGWDIGYDAIQEFGEIRLLGSLQVNASGAGGGAIQFQARRIALSNQFSSISSASVTQPGEAVEIVATDAIIVAAGSFITTTTIGTARAGDVTISTGQFVLRTGGLVGSATENAGRGGNVSIEARESAVVTDSDSFLYAQSSGSGNAGNLSIATNRLQVQSGGQISTTAFVTGNAGNLTIRANEVALTNADVALDSNGRPLFRNGVPISGGLFVGTSPDSRGNGGRLTITAQRLRLSDGAVLQATTYGSGDAGDIEIQATEAIEVRGISERGDSRARITASSGGLPEFPSRLALGATGRGGDLRLTTNRLIVQDGAIVAVNSRNPRAGGAGRIDIRANQMTLSNQGELNAQTESGRGEARIDLSDVNLLVLRGGSSISTQAGSRTAGGDGGNININAGFIVAAPTENSDIDADAGQGSGGNIDINARGILGIAERDRRTTQSDITATSDSGVDGEISINRPTVDPTQGIVELPSNIVDAAQLIAQGCRTGNRTAASRMGEFVVTGRGGLLPTPTDLRSSQTVITDWATYPETQASSSAVNSSAPVRSRTTNSTTNLVEAQGWVFDEDGNVKLVANSPTVTPNPTPQFFPDCLEQADANQAELNQADLSQADLSQPDLS